MTLYQFNLLDSNEQLTALIAAVYIGSYTDVEYEYKCYQLEDFYVERKRRRQSSFFLELRTFKNPVLLQPYLDQMDIQL